MTKYINGDDVVVIEDAKIIILAKEMNGATAFDEK